MGGTFDPIHHGHLVAASEVAARFGLDEVVFVPTGQPWQKADAKYPYSAEKTGMTMVPLKEYPPYVSSTPTSCQMKRPAAASS